MINKILNNIKKRKVLVKILSSSFLSLPVSIFVSFFTFRYIEPYYMGIWATVTILETYATFLRAGIINGMNRELPFELGQGKDGKAMDYASTTLTYTLFTSAVIIVIAPIILLQSNLSAIYILALSIGVIHVVLNQYGSYLGGTFRTSDNFNKLSNIQFINIFTKISLVPLVYFFAFYGYLYMQLLLVLINTVLLHYHKPFKVKPRFNKTAFFTLFKVGFPVFLSSYAAGFIATFPKLFILHYGSTKLLGLYAPVLTIITVFSTLPNTLSSYYYPKLSYALGKFNDAKSMFKTMLKIYGVSVLIIIPLIAVIYFALDYFVVLFPKYKDSLPYLEISLFIAPFVIAKLGNLISIILKQVNFMFYYIAFYAFFQSGFLLILYKFVSNDVLYCAIWSQIYTFMALLVVSIFLNFVGVSYFLKKSTKDV